MPTTSGLGLPYPPRTGVTPNVARDLEALAVALDRIVPRGLLTQKTRTATAGPATSSTGPVVVAGLSQSITLDSARDLELILVGQSTSNSVAPGTVVGVQLLNRTTGAAQTTTVQNHRQNYGQAHPVYWAFPLEAGTYTFDVRLVHFGGGDAGTGAYLTADPVTFSIKDLGPA